VTSNPFLHLVLKERRPWDISEATRSIMAKESRITKMVCGLRSER